MADGQELLDHMNDIIAEVDVQPTEADVARGLRSLNRAQDLLEMEIAQLPLVRANLGTHENVTTTADNERTAVPAGFLTVERAQFVDASTSRPSRNLAPIHWVGDISLQGTGLDRLLQNQVATSGEPDSYTVYGGFLYWNPIPDAVYTVRLYGFKAGADIAVGTTWDYGDELIWPVAAVGARVFKMRADDDPTMIRQFAGETFGPVLRQLQRRWKDGPTYFRHTQTHYI